MGRIRRKFKAFTLLELIVVVAIITVLTAIAVPSLLTRLRTSRIQAANDQAQSLYMAAQDYLISLQRKGVSSAELNDYFDSSSHGGYRMLVVNGTSFESTSLTPDQALKHENARSGILSRYQNGTGAVDIGCWIVYVYPKTFTVGAVFYNEGKYNDDPMQACKDTAGWGSAAGPFTDVFDGITSQEYSATYHDSRAYTGQYPIPVPSSF
jgi:prepilin-type N-terminal cleavage/methylation domain-containing protein